ncbi:alpha/beta fold hydrolase [Acidithiobacillus sp. AMEEHan]|uniref:alpha/beta fold hydrolase n=1 Tax=Acidithiobacillus sp. AMEEHan TaxID=2994951 RepID=UPI0027E5BC13|nr:alpha/beta fold hydrolase [Acidithiobacillus sp. AMEEHan]
MQLSTENPFAIPVRDGEVLRGYFQDSGQGVIGVFLPGFASDLNGSKSQLLASCAQQNQRSWLRFDYRGMGISDGSFAKLSISRYLEDVEAVLCALPSRPIFLVGSSMGGWVATRAAQLWPERIRALLLIAPAYNFIQDYFAALAPEAQQAWQSSGLHDWSLGSNGPVYQLGFDAVRDAARHDLLQNPPHLAIPVTILHGSADDAVPLQRSFQFADRARAQPLVIHTLRGVNHRLQGADRQLLAAAESSLAHSEGGRTRATSIA